MRESSAAMAPVVNNAIPTMMPAMISALMPSSPPRWGLEGRIHRRMVALRANEERVCNLFRVMGISARAASAGVVLLRGAAGLSNREEASPAIELFSHQSQPLMTWGTPSALSPSTPNSRP
jgi:hypothetical protein